MTVSIRWFDAPEGCRNQCNTVGMGSIQNLAGFDLKQILAVGHKGLVMVICVKCGNEQHAGFMCARRGCDGSTEDIDPLSKPVPLSKIVSRRAPVAPVERLLKIVISLLMALIIVTMGINVESGGDLLITFSTAVTFVLLYMMKV